MPDNRARAVFAGGEMSFIAAFNPGAITIESWKNFCDNPYGALCFRLIAGCKQSFCLRLDSVESAWHGKLHLLLLLKKCTSGRKGYYLHSGGGRDMSKAIIIMGSGADKEHCEKIKKSACGFSRRLRDEGCFGAQGAA